jgi:hypothetical protein
MELYLWHSIKIDIVGGGVQLGPLGTEATNRPLVLAPASQRLTAWATARPISDIKEGT